MYSYILPLQRRVGKRSSMEVRGLVLAGHVLASLAETEDHQVRTKKSFTNDLSKAVDQPLPSQCYVKLDIFVYFPTPGTRLSARRGGKGFVFRLWLTLSARTPRISYIVSENYI